MWQEKRNNGIMTNGDTKDLFSDMFPSSPRGGGGVAYDWLVILQFSDPEQRPCDAAATVWPGWKTTRG